MNCSRMLNGLARRVSAVSWQSVVSDIRNGSDFPRFRTIQASQWTINRAASTRVSKHLDQTFFESEKDGSAPPTPGLKVSS